MPVQNTFSALSKRGFGGFVPASTNGEWIGVTPFLPLGSGLNFDTCAISADGGRNLVFQTSGTGYLSTDFASTWNGIGISQSSWRGSAMNYNGQYIIAGGITLYVSNNFGASWASRGVSTFSWETACSETGEYMLAVDVSTNTALLSSNYGASFSNVIISGLFWRGAAISDIGEIQYLCGNSSTAGKVYKSTNFGSTWAEVFSIAGGTVDSIATSSDGTKVSVTYNPTSGGDVVYTSSDSGLTFAPRATIGAATQGTKIAISGSGAKQTAVAGYNGVWMSSDFGDNWTLALTGEEFTDIAISRDGRCQLATARWNSGLLRPTIFVNQI